MKREPNLKEFSISLKKLMRDRRMSITDFAYKTKISTSFLYRLLDQKRRPSREHVAILGIRMKLSVEEINCWLELTGHEPLEKKKVPIMEKINIKNYFHSSQK